MAVASEPFDGDADRLLFGGEALALTGRALVPHQFPVALARVTPRLSIEQRVLLHSQPLARVAGHAFRAAPLPTPIAHGADDVPHHEDLLRNAAILDDFCQMNLHIDVQITPIQHRLEAFRLRSRTVRVEIPSSVLPRAKKLLIDERIILLEALLPSFLPPALAFRDDLRVFLFSLLRARPRLPELKLGYVLIVFRARFRDDECLIGQSDVLEVALLRWVILVEKFEEALVGCLDLVLGCVALHTQCLVKVGHRVPESFRVLDKAYSWNYR